MLPTVSHKQTSNVFRQVLFTTCGSGSRRSQGHRVIQQYNMKKSTEFSQAVGAYPLSDWRPNDSSYQWLWTLQAGRSGEYDVIQSYLNNLKSPNIVTFSNTWTFIVFYKL